MKILLGESDPEFTHTLKTILVNRLKLSDIVAADNGNDVLMQIKNYTRKDQKVILTGEPGKEVCDIDLIIANHDITGIEINTLITEIRKLFNRKELPILVLTQPKSKEILVETLQSGANGFVLRPINVDTLNAKIAEVAKKKVSPKTEAVLSMFRKPVAVPKKKKVTTLDFLSAGKTNKQPERMVGAYYTASSSTPPAGSQSSEKKTPIENQNSIVVNGHYQENVNVLGGGTNCYWGKEIEGKGKVALEYVSPKGRPSGIGAKVVSREEFFDKFTLCTPETCAILKKLADVQPPSQKETKKKAKG